MRTSGHKSESTAKHNFPGLGLVTALASVQTLYSDPPLPLIHSSGVTKARPFVFPQSCRRKGPALCELKVSLVFGHARLL